MMAAYDVVLFPCSSCFIRKIDGNILRNGCYVILFFIILIFFSLFFPPDIEISVLVIEKFSASVADSDQKIEETFVVLHEVGLDKFFGFRPHFIS